MSHVATASMLPGLTQRRRCRAFGVAQYKIMNMTVTMTSSTGHLAISQAVTAALPMPRPCPTRLARPPVTVTITTEARQQQHHQQGDAEAYRGGLPHRPAFRNVVDDVRGPHEAGHVGGGGPQADRDAHDRECSGRGVAMLEVIHRAQHGVPHGSGCGLGHAVY